ncbi:hypothetical protein C8A05DRAFT_12142 [Staphylotrichum tortipilum]|uniref:Uncharacterized protein n=1 Tax=Staphylotrichum tortipilum TaxID=2831512 RepID=A0AAN6MT74_9PEZI|nr:hypothetical protein C8A05DRAFT_12142 [Staphylotrichum longicolle]
MRLALHQLPSLLLAIFSYAAQPLVALPHHHDDATHDATQRPLHLNADAPSLAGSNTAAADIKGYTLYTPEDLAADPFSEQCKTALTGTLACAAETKKWMSPGVRGTLDDAALQDEVCDAGCGASLAAWYRQVSASCVEYRWAEGAPLEMAGGYIWYGYNESCLTESQTGRYCSDVINEFSDSETLAEMPNSELCSECFTARVRMMQQSSYSVYNMVSWYQMALAAIQARCGLALPDDVPPPLIEVATPKPFCVSDEYYTITTGDTCNSIALAHSVSSADVVYAAIAAGAAVGTAVSDCSNLPTGLEMCIPLTCKTYSVKPGDFCMTISARAGIRDIALYNAWIDESCDNLHEANATLGHVVCLSPVGGAYVPGAATNTSGIPGGGLTASSPAAADPPSGATVAPHTRTPCGRWHVAEAGDTCAYITMAHSITLLLLWGMNPSVDVRTAGGCSASLVPGNAYCVSGVSPPAPIEPRALASRLMHFGCWTKPGDPSGVLPSVPWTDGSRWTLATCVKACAGDNLPLAGFDGGLDTCSCGDRVTPGSVRLSTSACADGGGGDGMSLYGLAAWGITLNVPSEPVGCFPDAALLAGADTPVTTGATDTMVSRCAMFCLPDYPFFGLSRGDTCRCGTGMAAGATPLDAAESCDAPCSGRDDITCGGEAATYIYASQIKVNAPDGES